MDPFALQPLHHNTFSKVFDSASNVGVLFDGGQQALLAETNVEPGQHLYRVDLVNAAVTTLNLKADTPLVISRFVSAGDQALAIFYQRKNVYQQEAYLIGSDGSLQPLIYLQYASYVTTQELAPNMDDLEPYLQAGQLDQLTEVQEMVCAWDGSVYQETGVERVHYFFNDKYLVSTNIDSMIERLQQKRRQLHTNGCEHHADPANDVWQVSLERQASQKAGAPGGRILAAQLYHKGSPVHRYDLSDRFYYWAVLRGERLYFVGAGVSYVDLDQAVAGD